MKRYSSEWWAEVADRMIRSIAQGFLTGIGASALVSEVNWAVAVSSAVMMGLVSFATSIAIGFPDEKKAGKA